MQRQLLRIPSRRTIALLVLLVVLGVFHGLVLRLLALPLTAAEASPACDYYCIHGSEWGPDGYEAFAAAAAWHGQASARKILVILPHDSRAVEIGALPSMEQICRAELGKLGIPADDICPVPANGRDDWADIHALADWLKHRPDATVGLACSSLGSGRLRFILNKVLGPADSPRVKLVALPDPSCRPDNWWRSRNGVKAFMFSWLDLFYAWAKGDAPHPLPADAATFQRSVRASIGEAP